MCVFASGDLFELAAWGTEPNVVADPYRRWLAASADGTRVVSRDGLADWLVRENPRQPVRLPVYAADEVDAEGDLIGIQAEADAFAYLIGSCDLTPPLAIGLFGELISLDGVVQAPGGSQEGQRRVVVATWRHRTMEATVRNPAIDALDVLIGEWSLTLTDAWFLESREVRRRGRAVFRWLGEAFVELQAELDGEHVWHFVFGRSDPNDRLVALYHDPRPTSRLFDMTFGDGDWIIARDDPDFHQRFVATVGADRIDGRWDASEDEGRSWRKDFERSPALRGEVSYDLPSTPAPWNTRSYSCRASSPPLRSATARWSSNFLAFAR
jgi:hypothetical protein